MRWPAAGFDRAGCPGETHDIEVGGIWKKNQDDRSTPFCVSAPVAEKPVFLTSIALSANHRQMTATTDFIAELVRAANGIDMLSSNERYRLVDRAVRTVRQMRTETGIRSSRGMRDALFDIEISAIMAEASCNDDDLKAILLDLADMIRALIVLDGKAEILRGE
jgi:hypothetical protein